MLKVHEIMMKATGVVDTVSDEVHEQRKLNSKKSKIEASEDIDKKEILKRSESFDYGILDYPTRIK